MKDFMRCKCGANGVLEIEDEQSRVICLDPTCPHNEGMVWQNSPEEAVNTWIHMNSADQPRKPVGMYGETPRVKIGKYTISRQDDRSVWIEVDEGKDEGEGGAFPDTLFEQCIEDFYNKNL